MLQRLIDDINKSLEHDCYFSALSLALILPDICGKAQYPDERSSKARYINWFDDHVAKFEKSPFEDSKVPYLSGEVIYSLRCSFLHQGNPNIEKEKIEDERCKIDHFILLTEKKNEYGIYIDSATFSEPFGFNKGKTESSYEVNIRRLCFILCRCAEVYYKSHFEEFDFFDYNIVDLDERYSGLPGYSTPEEE